MVQSSVEQDSSEPWLISQAIIGHVDVVDCVQDTDSVWAESGQYHWVLANVVLFDEPLRDIPGKLKLWNFDPENF